ncbi:nuclear protein UL24 [Equid herpesvirus 6]|uniref:Protein UL24 homolog n=1 Tax=Equid herpesvirus 6 TaxID=173566 RepID=A0A7S9VM38_9ALPH|nr:nuclear protein UL24 [Equid herpesvirus 6]QPI70147.1 nuclear protein UL24 [Equid herpesvirus 6]
MRRQQRLTARSRLRAGIRCHNRFYGALARDLAAAKRSGVYGERLAPLFSELVSAETLKAARGVSLAFEVNLGRRRPDCVCTVQLDPGADSRGVCILIELKTCRFSKNMNTASKNLQRKGGLRQLNDSCRLLAGTLPPGRGEIVLAPVLVFVAQRGMRVLRVTRLAPRRVRGNVAVLAGTISRLAEYAPPVAARAARPAGRRRTPPPAAPPLWRGRGAGSSAPRDNAGAGAALPPDPLAWVASLFAQT